MATSKSAPAKRFPKTTPASDAVLAPAVLIDRRIAELGDWRAKLLSKLRALINASAPGIVEEWKWNNPVWSNNGIICTGETYKKAVKLTFPKGASLADPAKLFNSSLEGNVRRAIDFADGALVDEKALSELVRSAVAANQSATKGKAS